jgi:ribose transport system substrate-binding protein
MMWRARMLIEDDVRRGSTVQLNRRIRSKVVRAGIAVVAISGVALVATYGAGTGAAVAAVQTTASTAALAPGVANAEASLAKIEAGVNAWNGPTTGPKLLKNQFVVMVAHDLSSPAEGYLATGIQAVASKYGWKVKVIDGQGTLTGMSSAIAQAIALKPNAIYVEAMPTSLYSALRGALHDGIPVICASTAPTPGVWKQDGCDVNIFQNYTTLGNAEADWAVIHSGGHLRGVIMTDKTYTIVTDKTLGIEDQFKTVGCTGCKVVLYTQVPFADEATTLPGLTTTWVQKYGTPLWLLDASDTYADSEFASLKTLGIKQGQVTIAAMDGNPPNLKLVASGSGYEESDIAIPYAYISYQVMDNINRIIQHAPISDPSTPIYVFDKSNIKTDGGLSGEFVPGNNYVVHFHQLWTTGKTS